MRGKASGEGQRLLFFFFCFCTCLEQLLYDMPRPKDRMWKEAMPWAQGIVPSKERKGMQRNKNTCDGIKVWTKHSLLVERRVLEQ